MEHFTLAELAEVQIGVLIPILKENGYPESTAAKRSEIVGMMFVLQKHNTDCLEALHEKLRKIKVNREAHAAQGNVHNVSLNKDGTPRAKSKVFGAVALVHQICDKMKDKPRAEVIAECVKQGVNKNTAATQYAAWNRKQTAGAV